MNPTLSSYRSSTSRRMRSIMRGKDNVAESKASTTHNIERTSRSNEYSALTPSASSKSASPPSNPERSRKESPSSPVMVFFRILFERCFTKRRRRRTRGTATRKMKNNNYQTRDDEGNVHGSGPRNTKGYSSIPTNEHEMFSMLHSKARSKTQRLPSNSNSGQFTIRHRNTSASSGRRTHVPSISPPIIIIEHRTEAQQLLLS